MATATTEVTYNFSVTGAGRDACTTQVESLLTPYEQSGVTTEFPQWSPPLPDNTYPPSSGLYTAVRQWTDSNDAQTFVNTINSWIAANPTPFCVTNWTIQIQS